MVFSYDGPEGPVDQYGIVVDVRDDDGACAVGWFLGVSGHIDTDDLHTVD